MSSSNITPNRYLYFNSSEIINTIVENEKGKLFPGQTKKSEKFIAYIKNITFKKGVDPILYPQQLSKLYTQLEVSLYYQQSYLQSAKDFGYKVLIGLEGLQQGAKINQSGNFYINLDSLPDFEKILKTFPDEINIQMEVVVTSIQSLKTGDLVVQQTYNYDSSNNKITTEIKDGNKKIIKSIENLKNIWKPENLFKLPDTFTFYNTNLNCSNPSDNLTTCSNGNAIPFKFVLLSYFISPDVDLEIKYESKFSKLNTIEISSNDEGNNKSQSTQKIGSSLTNSVTINSLSALFGIERNRILNIEVETNIDTTNENSKRIITENSKRIITEKYTIPLNELEGIKNGNEIQYKYKLNSRETLIIDANNKNLLPWGNDDDLLSYLFVF
jgi:hypothetical protein